MSSPTKMRASVTNGVTEVRALMQHEMETGRRKDETGKLVPAWYITDFNVLHNGRTVLEGQFGTSVSKNPFLVFRFKGGKAGDKLSLSWTDNRGEKRTDEAEIS
ncbi:MAG: thiosulfate oxidation carrier complex protein SoxZ [Gammaproteobacteria bacterium]|nr:thiosulfate oxidation carrier complex protein SoxZ [Gammaproteobacteria bacterium]MBU1776172.1 thiosulfate oxidation carrier complex protein SoxZ [Gammaproteobacteria bacterium]MBU1969917.1 thiosulfate oxidation carrier complex protein SoxZ [Gammaproteobacteria bacterium]